MKAYRYFLGVLGMIAVACLPSSGAMASSAHTAAAAQCSASINIEAPYATGPATVRGRQQLHFAQLAVAMANKANDTHITLGQSDTGLDPALAKKRAQAIVASRRVGVVGPASDAEVAAVGPLFAKAGLAFVSGSATLPSLTTSGANKTFFRVVPNADLQGSQDAFYAIYNHLAGASGSGILIADDGSAYSKNQVAQIMPVLTAVGFIVDEETFNGADTGAALQNDMATLISHITPTTHLAVIPWQSPSNAQLFGQAIQAKGLSNRVALLGTDGIDAPGQFTIPNSYVSGFARDLTRSTRALDKSIVSGVAKYGAYGTYGVPTWQATTVLANAIASVCKTGQAPTRDLVLAAVRKTHIPASESPMYVPISFQPNGDLKAQAGYMFYVNATGSYIRSAPSSPRRPIAADLPWPSPSPSGRRRSWRSTRHTRVVQRTSQFPIARPYESRSDASQQRGGRSHQLASHPGVGGMRRGRRPRLGLDRRPPRVPAAARRRGARPRRGQEQEAFDLALGERRVPRGVDADERGGGGDRAHRDRSARPLRRLSQPGSAGQDGGDAGRHIGRAPDPGRRGGLARPRERGVRLSHRPQGGSLRGVGRDRGRPRARRAGDVRRRLLLGRRPRARPSTGAAYSGAHRLSRAADARHHRALRGLVEHLLFGLPDDLLRERMAALDEALAATGRDATSLERTIGLIVGDPDQPPEDDATGLEIVGTPESIAAAIAEYERLGFTHVIAFVEPVTTTAIERIAAGVRLSRG